MASVYAEGTKGLPVWFDESLFEYLLHLKGDIGMRKIIGQFADTTTLVPFPQGEVDLDTPEQYREFVNKL